MNKFKRRVQSISERLEWLSIFKISKLSTLAFLLIARKNNKHETIGHFNDYKFYFRGCDISALKEVLVDEEYHFLQNSLKNIHKPIILDIGAHIGTFALWCLKQNPNAKILSVEADPKTYKILEKNSCSQNKINWTCINRAAWVDGSLLAFYDVGDAMSHRVSKEGSVKVKGITLKEIIKKINNIEIDILKIDIEGAEEKFICSNPEHLSKIKNLIIELHPQLCDVDSVRQAIAPYFETIEEVQGRISSKPLLYCY